jgi:hypothetical protein
VSRHKWLTAPFIVLLVFLVLGCEAEPAKGGLG